MRRCSFNGKGVCTSCGSSWDQPCRRPLTAEGAKRKNAAYSALRLAYKAAHPDGPVSVMEKRA